MLRDLRFVVAVLGILVALVALQFAQPMIVYGHAIDPDGAPIAGVLGTGHYTRGALQRAADRGNDSFVTGCLLCPSLRVRVSAPGFETERLQLSVAHPQDPGDRVVRRRYVFGLVQTVRVTLFPERPVTVSRIETELIFSAGAPRAVTALDPKLPQRASPDVLHAELRRHSRGAQTVAAYVALESDTEPDGTISRVPANSDNPVAVRWRPPANARLVLHHADGGFIAVGPLTGLPTYNRYRETLRRLRDAPEAGYTPVLTLDPGNAHLDREHFYFYCRFGERYGKGEISAIEVDAVDGTRLRAYVRIWLNEDGGHAMPAGY